MSKTGTNVYTSIIFEMHSYKVIRELQTSNKKMITSTYSEQSGLLALACDSQKLFIFDKNSLVKTFERIEMLTMQDDILSVMFCEKGKLLVG